MALRAKGSSISDSDIHEIFSSGTTTLVMEGIPSIVRSKNGKVEYLIVGHKDWIEIPDSFLDRREISHVENIVDDEPLVIVTLYFKEPSTDSENLMMRLFLGSLKTSSRRPSHAQMESAGCNCKGDTHAMTGPNYCAGCSYCGPCQPGYCYRPCVCNGVRDWCYDHVCCP